MVTITRLVRAESALDAELAAFLLLPPAHQESAVCSRCEPEPFLPATVAPNGQPMPQAWNVAFDLPNFDPAMAVAESMLRTVFGDQPEAA